MPSYPTLFAGTPITWKSSGGTYAFAPTSLADQAAWEGDKGDLYNATYGLPAVLECFVTSSVGTTVASDGKEIQFYFSQSQNATAGSDNPGGLTGASSSRGATLRYQITYAGQLPFLTGLTTGIQRAQFTFYPKTRYLIPYVFNNSGKTLGATAGDHTLTVTPYYRVV